MHHIKYKPLRQSRRGGFALYTPIVHLTAKSRIICNFQKICSNSVFVIKSSVTRSGSRRTLDFFATFCNILPTLFLHYLHFFIKNPPISLIHSSSPHKKSSVAPPSTYKTHTSKNLIAQTRQKGAPQN
jgi:hypothetical protein